MISMIRRMGRRMARNALTAAELQERKDSKTQMFRLDGAGGYRTLHPTRGWKHVCAARARAQGLVL
jgi:hypothetical protein